MGGRSRLLVAVPAIALLAFLSWWGVRWGLGDANAYAATREIARWTVKRVSPEPEAWMWVRNVLQRAESLSPSDPAVPELMGVLHLARVGQPEYAELALEHFGRALELRPSSPYTWANVAEARYRLGMTQPPFEQILVETWRLGPSEPETQRLLAELGLAMWDEIEPATQGVVRAAVGAAMRRNPLETLQIAQRRGRLSLACAHVPGDARLNETKWVGICGV